MTVWVRLTDSHSAHKDFSVGTGHNPASKTLFRHTLNSEIMFQRTMIPANILCSSYGSSGRGPLLPVATIWGDVSVGIVTADACFCTQFFALLRLCLMAGCTTACLAFLSSENILMFSAEFLFFHSLRLWRREESYFGFVTPFSRGCFYLCLFPIPAVNM